MWLLLSKAAVAAKTQSASAQNSYNYPDVVGKICILWRMSVQKNPPYVCEMPYKIYQIFCGFGNRFQHFEEYS